MPLKILCHINLVGTYLNYNQNLVTLMFNKIIFRHALVPLIFSLLLIKDCRIIEYKFHNNK